MPDWVTIARVLAARGNRGEVGAVSLSSHPERFEQLREVVLQPGGKRLKVESVWEHQRRWIFKFGGVDSISDAEQLAGMDICVPVAERYSLPEGEFYHSDLVGCSVIERATGIPVGAVESVEEYGGPALLRVTGAGREEILIPFARSICREIDLENRRVLVDLPEGLKELNPARVGEGP